MLTAAESLTGTEEDEDVALMKAMATCFLEDIAELQSTRKGKSKEGAYSDDQLALEMFAEEASSLLTSARDLEIALGLEKAMRMDESVIQELCIAEERASADREMALALSEGRPPPPRPPTPIPPEADAAAEDLSKAPFTANDEDDSDAENDARGASSSRIMVSGTKVVSATFSAPRSTRSGCKREHHDCVICGERIKGIEFHAPCGHYYDRSCLVDLYGALTRDEQLFPPRCCQQEFDFAIVRGFLPLQLATLYQEKTKEYRTVDRVYCHRPTCSTFLCSKTAHVTAIRCPRCSALTCGSCKAATHAGVPCVIQSDEEILALAEERGWKRCPGCHHLVELSFGCFHMTCRCRYQFCYLCTARWKTCACPQWDENRLLTAAHDQVERRVRDAPAARRAAMPDLNAMVARAMEHLREDHDCQHPSWQYTPGRGRSMYFLSDLFIAALPWLQHYGVLLALGATFLAEIQSQLNVMLILTPVLALKVSALSLSLP
ncbi:hypothetical protein NM688_g6953 [Phlebia brevispora]|uniref:Uncharacterized protein n=1 Tax=Phlebia brevispora TaxID=194682 RepID=A0ACC1SAX0_9APHY|nr:hypothetical protein NM688_g6953 [Phlebia brevispora]